MLGTAGGSKTMGQWLAGSPSPSYPPQHKDRNSRARSRCHIAEAPGRGETISGATTRSRSSLGREFRAFSPLISVDQRYRLFRHRNSSFQR